MKFTSANIASLFVPMLILLHLFSIGHVAGPFAGISLLFALVVFFMVLILQLHRGKPNLYFLFFLVSYLLSKIGEISDISGDRISNIFLFLTIISGFYKYLDIKKIKLIVMFWLTLNILVMSFQIWGVSELHMWNTLIDENIRANNFYGTSLRDYDNLAHNMLRPPGLFYSQAINTAFLVGSSFLFFRDRSLIIWLLCSVSLLLCGSKSAIIFYSLINVIFLIQMIGSFNSNSIAKFAICLVLIIIYISIFKEYFESRYAPESFLVSLVLRFYVFAEMLNLDFSEQMILLGGDKLTDRSDILNSGLDTVAFVVAVSFFSVFFPSLRTKIVNLLKAIYPLLLVSLTTSVSGSLVSYFLIKKKNR